MSGVTDATRGAGGLPLSESMEIVVRRPTLRDVDDLARINIDAWRSAYSGMVPQSRIDGMDAASYRQRWVDNVTVGRPGVAFFVADLDGVQAGYSIGGPYRPQEEAPPTEVTDRLGELYAIYVDPPHQGRGIGSALHESLLNWLAGEGYTEVALWVLEANRPSRLWYSRRGWHPDGDTGYWVADGQRLAEIRLRRHLPQGPSDAASDAAR
jgi:GNAT superfamily N-acetyltransferase